MRIRPSLTAGAIATVAAIAFAVPGIAGAANSPAPATAAAEAATAARAAVATAPPPISHASFSHSLGHMTTGKIAGIIAARGTTSQKNAGIVRNAVGVHAAAAAPAACTEPNCNLPYNGGPVQHKPRVYLVLWGPQWQNDSLTATYLADFFAALGSKSDGWTPIVQQYTDTTGHPTINASMLAGAAIDTSTPPNPVDDNALGGEAGTAATFFNIADPRNADIVIVSQSHTCFAPPDPVNAPNFTFAGNCGTPQAAGGYCAYHNWDVSTTDSSLYLPWVNLPYQPDAQTLCGEGFVNTPGRNDGFSVSGGHEVTETITDPIGTGWLDAADTVSGGEVADKCAWGGVNWNQSPPDPKGNLVASGVKYAVQSLWSNARSACVLYAGLTLSVTTPATQSSKIGTAITPLQISATVGGTTPLTYTATGLPPGLSINRTTGAISGTPGVTAGTFAAHVTVAYYYSSKTVSFTWRVAAAKAGNIKGWASKCVADYQAKTTAGAKVVLWPCANTASMNITFGSNNQLSVVGRCLTGTTTVFLEPCSAAGAKYQHWTRLSNGEYVLQSNGQCLTAPGQANGVQLVMAACKNAGNQRWSLPS